MKLSLRSRHHLATNSVIFSVILRCTWKIHLSVYALPFLSSKRGFWSENDDLDVGVGETHPLHIFLDYSSDGG